MTNVLNLNSHKNDQKMVCIGFTRLGQNGGNLYQFGDRIKRRKGIGIRRAIWRVQCMMDRNQINDVRRDIQLISCPADEITS